MENSATRSESGTNPMTQPATPAAELTRLAEEEARIAQLELALLERAAVIEAGAREAQAGVEQVRSALQSLAHSVVHGEAESLFNGTLKLEAPPHLVSRETSEALELRRRALAQRVAALRIEEEALQRRAAAIESIRRTTAELQQQAETLARRAREEEARRQRAAEAERRALEAAREAPAPVPAPEPIIELQQAGAATAPAAETPAATAAAPEPARHEVKPSTQRVAVKAEITLVSESNFFAGFSQDLSEMGVFVATYSQLLPVGTAVELSLQLPLRPVMKVPGLVKWVRDAAERTPGIFPGMGIGFEALSDADARAIQSFVTQREPLFWAE